MESMKFSKEILKSDGKLISKIFMGSTFNEIVSEAKKIFKENKVFKPLASRKDSKESFIICKFLR
jgi:23S rRNA (uridine2552-2'-O)-methyltransferase